AVLVTQPHEEIIVVPRVGSSHRERRVPGRTCSGRDGDKFVVVLREGQAEFLEERVVVEVKLLASQEDRYSLDLAVSSRRSVLRGSLKFIYPTFGVLRDWHCVLGVVLE